MNEIDIQVIPFLLPIMTFCHVIADYNLQGILANLKQTKWWEQNYHTNKDEQNASAALRIHSGSWAFMIMLPIMLFMLITKQYDFDFYIVALGINSLIHSIVDDAKCNQEIINYRTDQYIHMFQIGITWLIYFLIISYNNKHPFAPYNIHLLSKDIFLVQLYPKFEFSLHCLLY